MNWMSCALPSQCWVQTQEPSSLPFLSWDHKGEGIVIYFRHLIIRVIEVPKISYIKGSYMIVVFLGPLALRPEQVVTLMLVSIWLE